MKHIKTQQELNEAQENLNISDVSESYSLAMISIDSLIDRLKALKSTMKDKKFVISKLTWDDTKILFDKQYTKNIYEFFNNSH